VKRLYQKIYLTIVVALLLVVLVAGGIWRFGQPPGPVAEGFEVAGELIAAALPAATASATAQQDAIRQLAQRLRINLALFDSESRLIASYGDPPPAPHSRRPGWMPGAGAWAVPLPDGRWIVGRAPPRGRHPAIGLMLLLGGIALVIALCAYPVVRGLTRRLERLQDGVETLGAGNLAARVEVQGRDEVARLAQSFNRSAERIEELVNAHRLLLAHASHEIRTPLSRIRLGIELLSRNPDPKYKAGLEQDIAELDALVDDILLASRLDMNKTLAERESTDLLALAAEEGARYDDCQIEGEAVIASADPRLLRHLIRNLLDNAAHHGAPPLRVEVKRDGGNAIIDVMDAGSGIPEAERERVFVPFYRLPGETKGSGLGLSIARQIARLHGGAVIATSRPDSESCLRVTISASPGPAPHISGSPR
jgi:signal transduction histidine kinase